MTFNQYGHTLLVCARESHINGSTQQYVRCMIIQTWISGHRSTFVINLFGVNQCGDLCLVFLSRQHTSMDNRLHPNKATSKGRYIYLFDNEMDVFSQQ